MENPIKGKKRVLMFRLAEERSTKEAVKLALQTSHSIKESSKSSTTPTKDGTAVTAGELETSIDIEALASDTLVNDMLHYAVKEQKELEVWEVDFTKKGAKEGTRIAQYGTGYLSDWETPADVGESSTIKTTLTINGKLVKGEATVSELDVDTVNNYFRDTVPGAKEVAPQPDYKPQIDDGNNTGNNVGEESESKKTTGTVRKIVEK